MKLSNLANVLRAAGLTVVETAGWASRGYLSQDLQEVRGVLWHHTATNHNAFNGSDAPTLNMCIGGRPDLAGPLCNIVFGRTGVVYLVAAGVANHAGAGSAAGIPTNMGNHYLIGIEMESSGLVPWDWTLDQLRIAPHLGAALERAYGAELQIAHYEYSSQGKIDPAGWPGGMDGLRASINSVLGGGGTIQTQSTSTTPTPTEQPKEWFEMALDTQTKLDINEAVWGGDGMPLMHNYRLGRGEYPKTILGAFEGRMQNEILAPIRTELAAQSATVAGLVGALKAVTSGEAFDEAKLLAGVQAAARTGAEEGFKNAIDSIEQTTTTTVTLKEGEQA